MGALVSQYSGLPRRIKLLREPINWLTARNELLKMDKENI